MTDKDTERAEREAFEREHCSNSIKLTQRDSTTGYYVLPSISDAWAGWQSCARSQRPAAQAVAWRNAADDPPPFTEPIVVATPRAGQMWGVGIAYRSVSAKWVPAPGSIDSRGGWTH